LQAVSRLGVSAVAQRIRHILVAIGNLERPPRSALRKAAVIARASGASIELFHAIDAPDPGRSYPETSTLAEVAAQRAAIRTSIESRLRRIARSSTLRGVRTSCTAAWERPACGAIVRGALESRADLVIAATHPHRLGARLVLRNTDWELIRHCPIPLLLVKSAAVYRHPAIVAAVDPFHVHAKHADLDVRLLQTATGFARLLSGTTHVFHAYMPLVAVDSIAVAGASPVMLPPEVERAHSRSVARAVDQLAEKAHVPRARRHILLGDVAEELRALTRRTRDVVVVMGAVSRSALARLFIGNTAERVLDKLSCDVLIVKPRGFVARLKTGRSPRPGKRKKIAAAARPADRVNSTVTTSRVILPPLP
jgi:universal stress protein E